MPLVLLIRAYVFAAERIHADETTVPVQAKGECRTGRLWTYVRDDQPFGGLDPPAAAYFYSPDRGGKHPEQHLASYAGLMQADAYSGFNRLYAASRQPGPISDTLCRLASGGSFAVRQLYTDQDEVLFDAARPVILNGIEDVVSRPDLADRALFLTLPSLSEAQRRPEKELWQEFELTRPCLLGALLGAVSHGLRALPRVRLDRLPRMADFALWATACESAFWPARTFTRAYENNRRVAIDDAIDADPVAACVRELMAERSWIR
jgi:hypothetical protein